MPHTPFPYLQSYPSHFLNNRLSLLLCNNLRDLGFQGFSTQMAEALGRRWNSQKPTRTNSRNCRKLRTNQLWLRSRGGLFFPFVRVKERM